MVANLKVERWQVLHQLLRTIVERRAVLDAEEARCLREAYAMQLWRQLGYIHMGEYLEREMGYGPQVGAERLRVARELGALPRLEASLTAGELTYSAVRELTRIATGETEGAWLDEARGKNLRQVEAMLAGRKRGDLPGDPTTPELVDRVVRLELSPAAFALLRQTQAAMADEQGGRLDDSAFIEALCRRALERAAPEERPAHQIAFTVCESCKRGWQNGAGREIEVASAVVERAACDAEWIGSLEAAHPARVTTTVTPRLRRQIFARDQHRCTVPGCRSARNLDVHHVEYRRDGGGHEMSNTTIMCSGHHQQLHDGAMAIRGTAPDHLTFTWARGSETAPAAGRQAKTVSEPGRDARRTSIEESGRDARRTSIPDGSATERSPVADRALDTSSGDRDAREVLTASGYDVRVARAAVALARSHVGATAPLEDLLREAFRRCGIRGGG